MNIGRIFADLPPCADANDTVRAALLEVGDAGRDRGRAGRSGGWSASFLILDPMVSGNPTSSNPHGSNPDNPTMMAGSTFVGQFIDHDTFDQTSRRLHVDACGHRLVLPNERGEDRR